LMASCVRNIHTKNYQNLIIDSRKCQGCFFETQCTVNKQALLVLVVNITSAPPLSLFSQRFKIFLCRRSHHNHSFWQLTSHIFTRDILHKNWHVDPWLYGQWTLVT